MPIYKVGSNTFSREGEKWIARGPDGSVLGTFDIGAQARKFLDSMRTGASRDAPFRQRSEQPVHAVKRGEVHPDFVKNAFTLFQVKSFVTRARASGWTISGDIDDDDTIRLVSPDRTKVYVYVASRKIDRFFMWASSPEGSKIDGFDFAESLRGG